MNVWTVSQIRDKESYEFEATEKLVLLREIPRRTHRTPYQTVIEEMKKLDPIEQLTIIDRFLSDIPAGEYITEMDANG